MNPLATPVAQRVLALPPAGGRWRSERAGISTTTESWLLFAIVFIVFSAVGIWLIVDMKVLALDAGFRLSHAFMVGHGDPPKLAAIGFVWPPLMTLAFLPFALITPLSTSLVMIPLTSAFAAAGSLVVLNRMLARLELPRVARYGLLMAFAANPMFVHYATNGMSEMLTFFWLVLGLHLLMSWHSSGNSGLLGLSGLTMALGILSRYELAPYAVVMWLAIFFVLWRRRASRREIEGSLLLFAAPVVYGLLIWMLLCFMIMGNPLYFFSSEVTQRFGIETLRSAAQGGAGGQNIASVFGLTWTIISLYWHLFAVQLVVLVPLGYLAIRRRDGIALLIATLILLNPLMTAVFVKISDISLLQLRFNMRSMPLAIAAIGWIFWSVRGRWRTLVAVAGIAALVASIPLSWQTMKTYHWVFADHDFVQAIETGKAADRQGIGEAHVMADYINSHVHGEGQVLVDEAQTFLPPLVGGHPELFLTRIDLGDTAWLKVLDNPRGKVGWMLMQRNSGVFADLVLSRYRRAPEGGVPFLVPVFYTRSMVLVRVEPRAPLQGSVTSERRPRGA